MPDAWWFILVVIAWAAFVAGVHLGGWLEQRSWTRAHEERRLRMAERLAAMGIDAEGHLTE